MATPIKIEANNIYRYDTNVVNNNKIDCVNIEETVFGDVELIDSKTINLRAKNEAGQYEDIFENENIEIVSENTIEFHTADSTFKKRQLTFRYEISCPNTFMTDSFVAFTYRFDREIR